MGPLLEREVVPHQKCRQHGSLCFTLRVLEEAMLPGDNPALPDAENDPTGVITVPGETDGVRVPAPHLLHRLRAVDLLEPADGIPKLGRPLVILDPARFVHPFAEPGPYVDRLPLEEQKDVIYHAAIVPLRLVVHAGSLAPLDVVVQAGPVRTLFRKLPVAGADGEEAPDDLQGLPQRSD